MMADNFRCFVHHVSNQIKFIEQLDSLCWFSQRRSQCRILGGAHPGGYDPHSNSVEIFVQCTYPQVSSSYVYLFGSYRVDKQTNNKQTDVAENIQRPSLRYNVG